jgi:cysteine desulfuration protein SufE
MEEIKEGGNKTIEAIQNEIVEEFSVFGGERESIIFYIMELGQKLPTLPEKYKTDEFLIKGCQSKVWLFSEMRGDRIYYFADSNTEITKGLISLLIRVLSGQTAEDIIHANLFFIEKIGMGQIIGAQRSNGLTAMIKQMKLYALAFNSKLK